MNSEIIGLCSLKKKMTTPYYLYDLKLLEKTLQNLIFHAADYRIHYAIKANTDYKINKLISSYGLGADCVSGNEILHALKCGFSRDNIVFAGVGKTDQEISIALENNIGCFNIESFQELKVIHSIAQQMNKHANIAIRVNPNVDVDTHQYIKTGINENKFGVSIEQILELVDYIEDTNCLCLTGLHFHIGSQITNFRNFEFLAKKVNFIIDYLHNEGVEINHLNLGGGLGIDYENPAENPIADFKNYFDVFRNNLSVNSNCKVHFELGRSIVGQCGELHTKVVYIKEGINKRFAIIDAGMTDLLRPALYQAKHKIVKQSKTHPFSKLKYDIVGPICESSDVFRKDYFIEELNRGDLLVIKSCGAYGQVMCSSYNLRNQPKSYYIETENKSSLNEEIKLALPTYLSLKNLVSNNIILQ